MNIERLRLGPQPYYQDALVSVYNGDCREIMPKIGQVDLILCDPPYGLEFMGQEWDKLSGDMPAGYNETPRFQRNVKSASKFHGFTGAPNFFVGGQKMQDWHYSWAVEAIKVLKPGGFLLAFGGTRTFHRLTCALEDAGFEIRDCLMWLYGAGFPKSLDVSKRIDKEAGVGREIIGSKDARSVYDGSNRLSESKVSIGFGAIPGDGEYSITAPATDAAKQWQGWGTALKPSWEPIVLARKPIEGTVAQNVQKYGTGAMNIDACRIGIEQRTYTGSGAQPTKLNNHGKGDTGIGMMDGSGKHLEFTVTGRWPANLLLTHHPECEQVGTKKVKGSGTSKTFHEGYPGDSNTGFIRGVSHPDNQHADADGNEIVESWNCHPDCPVRLLDEQSGERPGMSGGGALDNEKKASWAIQPFNRQIVRQEWIRSDTGGASRFFYTAKSSPSERGEWWLDSSQIDYYIDPQWVNAVLNPVLQAGTGKLPQKVTGEFGTLSNDGSAWSTCWCGSLTTDPFHPVIKSIIEMEISSIIGLKISNLKHQQHTKGCMAVVFGIMASGGSLADSAECSSPWARQIGISLEKGGHSMDDAALAISVESWLKSVPGKGGWLRVRAVNSHPT